MESSPSSPKRRVLVVDDDPLTRETHARMLKRLGYDVETAADGIEALALLPLEFDLVVSDAEMPNMDGYEVARRIREDERFGHVPIVMVTGLASRADRLRAYDVGINDFINKPVDMAELKLRTHWLAELKSSRDALLRHQEELESTVERKTAALRDALMQSTEAKRATYAAHLDTIRRLSIAAEYRDKDTADHITRIGLFSEVVARKIGMSPNQIELIRHAAPMHDVGKLGVPDSVLLKPGPLDEDELVIMRAHTTMGAQILGGSSSPVIQMGERIALTHHEKWDGSGYPDGVSGDDIALEGRICAVVDVFDALCSHRPYKDPIPVEKVLEMVREDAGKHFDPALVEAFLNVQDQVAAIRQEYSG